MSDYIPEWSWEAKARQLSENSKPGDIVDVGYISETSRYNYRKAEITHIIQSTRHTNGREEPCYQVQIRFEDGFECWW